MPSNQVPVIKRFPVARLAIVAAAALLLSIFVAPAQPALAMACSISPSLQASAAREGIFCGDASNGGEGPGGFGTSPVTSGCKSTLNTDSLPGGFFGFTKYGISHANSIFRSGGRMDSTLYTYGDRVTGSIAYIIRNDGTWLLSVENRIVPGWMGVMIFDCANNKDGVKYELREETDKHITSDGQVYLAPPAAPSPTDSDEYVAPTDTRVTAVPGSPGDYVVRINLTNSEGLLTPLFLSLATSSYSVQDVLALAPGASCNALDVTEMCVFPSIDAHETQTIVIHVALNPGAPLGSALRFSAGGRAVLHLAPSVGDPTGRNGGLDVGTYDLEMPTS